MHKMHGRYSHYGYLEAELGTAPVTPLHVVAHGVAGTEANPVRDLAVLLHGAAHDGLDLESLVGRHHAAAPGAEPTRRLPRSHVCTAASRCQAASGRQAP